MGIEGCGMGEGVGCEGVEWGRVHVWGVRVWSGGG